jgi:hypothetical protein
VNTTPALDGPDPQRKLISVSRVVHAAPQQIFDILAAPARHREIDGSNSVRDPLNAPERLFLGAHFSMSMRIVAPYRITNVVVEFEEPRRIAWRHFGGHVWRYILEPVDGGTLVTEQFDYAKNRAPLLLALMRAIPNNERSMRRTLDTLAARFS